MTARESVAWRQDELACTSETNAVNRSLVVLKNQICGLRQNEHSMGRLVCKPYHIMWLIVNAEHYFGVPREPGGQFEPEFAKLLRRRCCGIGAVSNDLK